MLTRSQQRNMWYPSLWILRRECLGLMAGSIIDVTLKCFDIARGHCVVEVHCRNVKELTIHLMGAEALIVIDDDVGEMGPICTRTEACIHYLRALVFGGRAILPVPHLCTPPLTDCYQKLLPYR